LRQITDDLQRYQVIPVSEDYVLFATGDGRDEDRVCKGFAHKFDGDRVNILSFKSPLPRETRSTGLASLAVVKQYIEKFAVKRLFWTCDKEHLNESTNWVEQIRRSLTSFGITTGIESQWTDAARLELAFGSKFAVLWCALTGIRVNLEENLSELIYLQFHERVSSDKTEIIDALDRRGLKIEDLIGGATRENLRLAAPSLFNVFEDIENFYSARN